MIQIVNKHDCCGCTACASACNLHAISMDMDEEGFFYPHVNLQLCTNCSLCERVCPIIRYDTIVDKNINPTIFALYHRDDSIRQASSSGGVFAALVDYAFLRNGIAYGAVYDKGFVVKHKKAENKEEAMLFRGSKYVQSDMLNIYIEVKRYLDNGRYILFSGTPCQVEGLKCFLRKRYANLTTVDILCHGVPSPKVFSDYVSFIRRNSDFELTKIYMKDKTFGWKYPNLRLYFGSHVSQFNTVLSNLWNKIYYGHLVTRPSCYTCRFTNYHRSGDITIGDFWGIEKVYPKIDMDKGISLIMLNNNKGLEVWNCIKEQFEYIPSNIKECVQPNLQHPVCEPVNRDAFWMDYQKFGFDGIAYKYWGVTKKELLKNRIKTLINNLREMVGI